MQLKKKWHSIKRSVLSHLAAYGVKICVRLLLLTCKIQVEGLERFRAAAQTSPCLLMFWHNRLIAIPELLAHYAPEFIYTGFVSKSRDGDAVAILAKSYKIGRALRVPHNARHSALNQMITHLKKKGGVVLIAPDGPRGPRYQVKPGVVFAAKEAAAKIIPFSWSADKLWTLNSWDKMMIPKPFATIKVVFGKPLVLEKHGGASLQEETAMLAEKLLQL